VNGTEWSLHVWGNSRPVLLKIYCLTYTKHVNVPLITATIKAYFQVASHLRSFVSWHVWSFQTKTFIYNDEMLSLYTVYECFSLNFSQCATGLIMQLTFINLNYRKMQFLNFFTKIPLCKSLLWALKPHQVQNIFFKIITTPRRRIANNTSWQICTVKKIWFQTTVSQGKAGQNGKVSFQAVIII
jgi:hypothetical protein